MQAVKRGRYRARALRTGPGLEEALAFRRACFGLCKAADKDSLDEICPHVIVQERSTADLVCYFRMNVMPAAEIGQSYAARFYDVSALEDLEGPLLELGRFCLSPKCKDPDVLRVAWAAITQVVDYHGVKLLFGCSSFEGIDPARYGQAFALLKSTYLAPRPSAPRIKAPEVFEFSRLASAARSEQEGRRELPPLLRSYLAMGAWVSDHAVIDRTLNTLHVFTGLDVHAIPEGRKRLLRAL
ncbi:MAG: GNAT family N-acyltransferase [Pseudomonadota bacterium]